MGSTPERFAYTVKEAAAALGVSEWIVREQIRTGRIDSVRLGTRILIPRYVLERLMGLPEPADGDRGAVLTEP